MNIANIKWEDWDQKVNKSDKPVIVEFWHQNCPTCKKIEPTIEELSRNLGENVILLRLDVLESRENRILAIKAGVMGTPTFKIYCNETEVGELVGEEILDNLQKKLQDIIAKCR